MNEYEDALKEKRYKNRDSEITSSVNALSTLGLTAGVGSLIAGKDNIAMPTIGGVAATAGGYHLARIAGLPLSLRLVVGALMGGSTAWAINRYGKSGAPMA